MGFMKRPKMAAPPPPPPPPVALPDPTDAAVRQRQHEALGNIRRRRGRGSTIMSGTTGDTVAPPTRRRQLGYGGTS